jgi:hypothetical protein
MTRIFTTMAALNAFALLITTGFGIAYFLDLQQGAVAPGADQPLGATWHMAHFVFGLFTVVFTLLVHCLIFTYFLGTGRWVKEVARAYQIPDEGYPRATREFKRQVFPPALFSMLIAIAAAAAGAGAQTQTWPWWSHMLLAGLTLLINFWAFGVEYRIVNANGKVLDQIMEEVNQRRQVGERGV